LQAQLSSGVKTINDSKVKVDLTETDKARIKNEIQTLKSRI
jgi:vacuolar-type H+-ATPase subunit E/Vma4